MVIYTELLKDEKLLRVHILQNVIMYIFFFFLISCYYLSYSISDALTFAY